MSVSVSVHEFPQGNLKPMLTVNSFAALMSPSTTSRAAVDVDRAGKRASRPPPQMPRAWRRSVHSKCFTSPHPGPAMRASIGGARGDPSPRLVLVGSYGRIHEKSFIVRRRFRLAVARTTHVPYTEQACNLPIVMAGLGVRQSTCLDRPEGNTWMPGTSLDKPSMTSLWGELRLTTPPCKAATLAGTVVALHGQSGLKPRYLEWR
jgi:hypothetical protein